MNEGHQHRGFGDARAVSQGDRVEIVGLRQRCRTGKPCRDRLAREPE
jgi:hypothetical protein